MKKRKRLKKTKEGSSQPKEKDANWIIPLFCFPLNPTVPVSPNTRHPFQKKTQKRKKETIPIIRKINRGTSEFRTTLQN